jgi:TolA-binding protein
LAREVAAYREAAALVATSPGLALVRLRAHRDHFPSSPLAPEVSLRIVQAFTALGRETEARREARSFVIRYPHNAKRAEMQAVADGAPLERPEE